MVVYGESKARITEGFVISLLGLLYSSARFVVYELVCYVPLGLIRV